MTRHNRVFVVAIAVLVGLSSSLLANAYHRDPKDGNDTRGMLDVKRVKSARKHRPSWRVITFAEWTPARIWDAGYVLVELDTFGNRRYDYYIQIESDGFKLRGRLWKDRRKKADRIVGAVKVWRKDQRSVSTRLKLKRVRVRETHFRWYAQTIWVGDNCRKVCFDVVPSRKGVTESLLPPEPTPTPTPSPTISPTPVPSPSP